MFMFNNLVYYSSFAFDTCSTYHQNGSKREVYALILYENNIPERGCKKLIKTARCI